MCNTINTYLRGLWYCSIGQFSDHVYLRHLLTDTQPILSAQCQLNYVYAKSGTEKSSESTRSLVNLLACGKGWTSFTASESRINTKTNFCSNLTKIPLQEDERFNLISEGLFCLNVSNCTISWHHFKIYDSVAYLCQFRETEVWVFDWHA